MKPAQLFGYTCPECGLGTVETTRVFNYRTKIRGFPFVIDEALIGVCNHCGAKSFAAEETRSWEARFQRHLESRRAVMAPEEIRELRAALGLSMEDFARLIGCTRQSISAWERPERNAPPSRTADLLMKLLRQSLSSGSVDVLRVLVAEAKKWGVMIEVRQRNQTTRNATAIVLRPKDTPGSSRSVYAMDLALAAQDAPTAHPHVEIETQAGDLAGILDYDFERAALVLELHTGVLPWRSVDAEVVTQDGQSVVRRNAPVEDRGIVLQENTELREREVAEVRLLPHIELS